MSIGEPQWTLADIEKAYENASAGARGPDLIGCYTCRCWYVPEQLCAHLLASIRKAQAKEGT